MVARVGGIRWHGDGFVYAVDESGFTADSKHPGCFFSTGPVPILSCVRVQRGSVEVLVDESLLHTTNNVGVCADCHDVHSL